MKHFVYGDSQRIFLNTALGCSAHCQYCYLSGLGIGHNPHYISAEETLTLLQQSDEFVPGADGTVLSLGCYSECWDCKNKSETIKLLSNLADYGNYIQMATKQAVSKDELKQLDALARYPGQIGLYLSTPTLSHSVELEPGTASIKDRLAPLNWQAELKHIYLSLYIKPVLPDITLEDASIYCQLAERYHLPIIIGPLLVCGESTVQVGEGFLQEADCDESEVLKRMLEPYGHIYVHSMQIIDDMRTKRMSKERY